MLSQTPDAQLLKDAFDAAVAAADAKTALAPFLPQKPKGKTVVIGAGKGAAQLGAAFEELWDGPLEGVVVTRYGYGAECQHLKVMEASHPVPDANGMAASAALVDAVSGLTEDDLVVALICGGGSALLPAPASGMALEDEQALNEALLASGAPIGVMNAIRKCASTIKGGRLAALSHPAKVVSLVVSDVPGDDPAQVASGPTVPDDRGLAEARAFVETYRIDVPEAVAAALVEPPRPGDAVFAQNEVHVIASAGISLEAAARHLEGQGVPAVILSDAIEGEATDIGQMHAAMALEVARKDRPFKTPVAVLSGGETTVTLKGKGGRGGRNTEFLLAAALVMEGQEGITALAADTDGIDGSENNAGAFADGMSTARMRSGGVDPLAALSRNDAWGAFEAAGDLFVPGPTGTNVNDFRAFLIRS